MNVGGEADDPLHVVAIDLARRGAVVDRRDVGDAADAPVPLPLRAITGRSATSSIDAIFDCGIST